MKDQNRTRSFLKIISVFVLLLYWFACGTSPSSDTSSDLFEGGNSATRPTPGFAIVSGNTADSGLIVIANNSLEEGYATFSDEEGSFNLEVRQESAYRVIFFKDNDIVGTLEFPKDEAETETTTAFYVSENTESISLGTVTFEEEEEKEEKKALPKKKARPEKNPLSQEDRDKDSKTDLKDKDDDNDGIPDLEEKDTDEDGFDDDIDDDDDNDGITDWGTRYKESFTYRLIGQTVNSDLYFEYAEKITIVDSTILGNLNIVDSQDVSLDKITVEGDGLLENVIDFDLTSSHIAGNLTISLSHDGSISENTIGGNYVIQRSSQIETEDNTVEGEIIEKRTPRGRSK